MRRIVIAVDDATHAEIERRAAGRGLGAYLVECMVERVVLAHRLKCIEQITRLRPNERLSVEV